MFPHRILIVHNKYLQHGGEDVAVNAEAGLLRGAGLEVRECVTSNNDLTLESIGGRVRTAAASIWSAGHLKALRSESRRFRPTVVHCHNVFPVPSPAAYYAARAERVPVVQTLHNYRLMCLNATFTRDSEPCFKCLGRWPTAGIVHRCYRGSLPGSLATAAQLVVHRMLGTWTGMVDRYIALTEGSRELFVEGGLPPEKIVVKPNFIDPDPGRGDHSEHVALFVGRLSAEKGIQVLLDAWQTSGGGIHLRIIGNGPLVELVREHARRNPEITFLGEQTREQVIEQMKLARLLVLPSLWAEGLPFVSLEAMAVGLPILCSDFQNLDAIVVQPKCGWSFKAGSPGALVRVLRAVWEDDGEMIKRGDAGRRQFLSNYTAESTLRDLMTIYDGVLAPDAKESGAR